MSDNLLSIFYPISPSTVADPKESAAQFAEQYFQAPHIGHIVNFAEFIVESTATKPGHLDPLIQATLLIYRNESLPTVYWTIDRPKSTFDEVFHVAFRDEIHSNLLISEISERANFLNASFIAGRACSLGLLTSPEIVGAVGEGLRFPDYLYFNSMGIIAEIRALGSCLQLLGCASELVKLVGGSFAVERVVKYLEEITVSAADKPLVDVSPYIRTTISMY